MGLSTPTTMEMLQLQVGIMAAGMRVVGTVEGHGSVVAVVVVVVGQAAVPCEGMAAEAAATRVVGHPQEGQEAGEAAGGLAVEVTAATDEVLRRWEVGGRLAG